MEDILQSDSKQKKVELSFKPSSFELNDLHLTFNKVAKTINIANQKTRKGEEYKALIDYSEAYHIFADFQNNRKMGICLSNIGTLRMRLKEYSRAEIAFTQAAESIQKELGMDVEYSLASVEEDEEAAFGDITKRYVFNED